MSRPRGRPPGPAGACPWCGVMFHTEALVQHIKGRHCEKKPEYIRRTEPRKKKSPRKPPNLQPPRV